MGLFEVVHHDVKTVFFTAYIRIDFDGNRVDLAEFKKSSGISICILNGVIMGQTCFY